ncbi:acyl carrier protein phosphodiesterase [Chitinophaga vietnamensis]|uniref:acyl carrier protein phosphodiesterase n=1 Tax=Chitinophaga vietnamensis TaxID=2593957 RepID=UPI001178A5F2|nr:ACP phosphodiesterase [Chitinophaga vietnamensis]
MNHLAHAYLSFREPELIVGNLIADFVKGKKQLEAQPPGIRRGIIIHRAIDTFTDQHPVTAQAKQYFKPAAGLYSGVFTDLVFDHFLACDTSRFTNEALFSFARYVYKQVNEQQEHLPPAFLDMFHYMQQFNWLYNYHTVEGIGRSIRGVASRAHYLKSSPELIFAVFMEHYAALQECYQAFFPELEAYTKTLLTENR